MSQLGGERLDSDKIAPYIETVHSSD